MSAVHRMISTSYFRTVSVEASWQVFDRFLAGETVLLPSWWYLL